MNRNIASHARRILVSGATGTIGSAVVKTLSEQGFKIVALVRPGATVPSSSSVEWRSCDVTNSDSLWRDGVRGEPFDGVISCLASRKGGRVDAWRIDDHAQRNLITIAQQSGIKQFILLSAICVQRPKLEFQFAKLSAEKALMDSGLSYSIVRPTAFFKSLAGQIERVKSGKSYLMFGDGKLTACKPISDRDLAAYLVACLDDESRKNKILPIGGPGRAMTPREQGDELFRLLNMRPKFKSVPIAVMDAIIGALSLAAFFFPSLKDKAEFVRIGKYYATESMLLLDPVTGDYNADLTPSTGQDHLFNFYADVVAGRSRAERGDHSVF